jgi:hypothetical protein
MIFCYKKSSAGLRAERLHPRIAGVSPACGCTQPPLGEFISQQIFYLPIGKLQAGRLRSFKLFFVTKNIFP